MKFIASSQLLHDRIRFKEKPKVHNSLTPQQDHLHIENIYIYFFSISFLGVNFHVELKINIVG